MRGRINQNDFRVIKEMVDSGEELSELQVNKALEILYKMAAEYAGSEAYGAVLNTIHALENARDNVYER